jgi:hypothetical protein
MSSTPPAIQSSLSAAAARPRHGIAAPPGVESISDSVQAPQDFTFSDFLSVINPLQHIPIVGTIYRAITGDTLAPAARVLGGTLFGGPIGLLTSAFNAIIEQTNGKDLGDQALALAVPGIEKPPASVQTAEQLPSTPDKDAEASPAPAPLTTDAGSAPPLRAAGMTTPSAPSTDRTPLSASLANRQRHAGDGSAAPGRTLADYRSFAGRPLPSIDATRSASSATPVRLQTTGPITPERGRPPATSPVNAVNAGEISPSAPATVTTVEEGGAGTPQTHWFQAAMMKGLDRYREGRRPEAAPTPRLDTTL